jgi:O-antigen ligase
MIKEALKIISRWELIFLGILAVLWVIPGNLSLVPFLGLPLFWVGYWFRKGHFFPPTLLDGPIFLLAVLTLLSLSATPSIEQSAGKVMGVVLGICLYYAVLRMNTEIERWSIINDIIHPKNFMAWLIVVYLGIGGAAAAAGLLGANWFSKYPLITRITNRIPQVIPPLPGSDSGFQPNAVSGTLTFFTPLAFYLAWILVRSRRDSLFPERSHLFNRIILILLLMLAAVQGTWWFLAQTRGAWLGLAASLLFLVVLILKPKRKAGAWILALLPVFLVYLYWFRAEAFSQLGFDLGSLRGANLSNTLQYRFQVWGWAGQVLQDFPLTGLGYDMFRELAPVYYGGPDLRIIAHAHNTWLDIGVTLGYGGIVVYASLWMVHLVSLWKTWKEHKRALGGQAALGLLAGWLAYFVFGLADTIPLGSKFGLAIFLSLGVGQVVVQRENAFPLINQKEEAS